MTNHYYEGCEFCDELNGGENNTFRALLSRDKIKSRFIEQTENFAIFPTLGAFVPGYILVVPKAHVFNLGQIPDKDFSEFEEMVNNISQRISRRFMQGVIFFEHGATNTCKASGACIDHAHLHICPTTQDVRELIERRPHTKHPLNSFCELKKWESASEPYLFYQGLDGCKTVYMFCDKTPSQFVRRLLAQKLHIHDEWDYLRNPVEGDQ